MGQSLFGFPGQSAMVFPFGSVHAKFEPNSAVSTLMGAIAAQTKGDAQMKAPTAKEVLALIAKSTSENLNNAIWKGKRNANGDTSMDLFDGFDTITENEIKAGNLTAAKNNYMKLTEAITSENAVDVAKMILFSLDPRLRVEKPLQTDPGNQKVIDP